MADKERSEKPQPQPAVDAAFRREAALAILGAWVQRHGGFTEIEMRDNMRLVWKYAGVFCEMESQPVDPPPLPAPPPEPKRRRSHPTDEFAVEDGGRVVKGFQTFEEAEFFAAARQGARVKQIAGPEVERLVAADA